jgi:hypothetical protein
MGQKKIATLRTQEQALKALADNENGADLNVLRVLAGAVISDEKIEPDFQLVANAIVAQSVLFGKLPSKTKGRPKSPDGVNAKDVAEKYFRLRDNGVSYSDAVANTSARFHKDERHIMRLVKEGKSAIGNNPEDRKRHRAWWTMCAEMHQSVIDAGGESALDRYMRIVMEARERDSQRDPMAELDDLIDKVLARINIADTNSV